MNTHLSSKEFNQMRLEFSDLSVERTKVGLWKTFFDKYPYTLSSTVPFSVQEKAFKPVACGANPDALLYAHRGKDRIRFGIIELTWTQDNDSAISYPYQTLRLFPDIEFSFDYCHEGHLY